jgi:hypothetical protein
LVKGATSTTVTFIVSLRRLIGVPMVVSVRLYCQPHDFLSLLVATICHLNP